MCDAILRFVETQGLVLQQPCVFCKFSQYSCETAAVAYAKKFHGGVSFNGMW